MAYRNNIRLGLNMAYLTVLFGAMLWVYVSLTYFDALLRLEPGRSEHVAFAPAETKAVSLRKALPAEILPFDIESTVRRLSREQTFSVQELPFALSLRDVNARLGPYQDFFTLDKGKPLPVSAGDTLPGGLTYLGAHPWRGLVANTRGLPCAKVLLCVENRSYASLLIESERWTILAPDVALVLHWHADEATAQAAAAAEAWPELNAKWWEVKDGERTQRMTSLAPGAGVELEDDSVWTLLSVGDDFIEVLYEDKASKKLARRKVPANDTYRPDAPIRFMHPGGAEVVVTCHAWEDGRAIVRIIGEGAPAEPLTVAEGESIPLPGTRRFKASKAHGHSLYLAQVLAYGLPTESADEPVQEAVIVPPSGAPVYIREGTTSKVGDTEIAYTRKRHPPLVTLHLSAHAKDGKVLEKIWIQPQRYSQLIGNWRISQPPPQPDRNDPNGYLLRVQFEPFTIDRVIGIALFMLGGYGWVFIRFRNRRA
jgi:hypothetical protein